ncbi:copper resistance CopC/CopD family protein [Streptomyces sp. Je 1-369]|uniref:copper resistance CopC/CopD family protein n=1 Tax=Streptomyces sp. Je 1-369 TaxID=2966192 RepID=UPI00228645EC|nr:copper resistance protein CopC [Streptomyces sp. Je 1-369]WAL96562.1 copper resistance protein CopC [Streptomyces sp. Je 1-369]
MQTIASRCGIPRLWQLLLVLLAATGLFFAGAAPSSAHAALTGSDPKQGAVVERAPDQVKLTFSEKVAMSDGSVRVLDPSGKRVDTEKTTDLGSNTYGVKLRPGLPDGTFTVAYQVVSADSHPVAGAYTFSIGAPSDTKVALPDQEAGGGLVGGLYDTARYLSYAGFILLVGGAAFVLGCWPRGAGARPVQRLVTAGWVTLTAATLALLLLRAPYTSSGKLADAFDMGKLGDVLNTKTGAALVSRLLLLAAAALFIAVLFGAYVKREGPGQAAEKKDLTFGLAIGGTVVALGIAATWAMAEHASTGIQTGIAMPVDVLHLLAVATWLGGLAALLVALFRTTAVDASAVQRFSTVAFTSVVVLAATGTYQAWRQVGSWSALTGTSYGQLLLVKIGLVAVLVGVASISRRWTGHIATEANGLAPEAAAAMVVEQRAKQTAKQASRQTSKQASSKPQKKPVTVPASGQDGDDDPERSAQLARQQAAMDTAREKRIRDADPHRSGLRRSVLAEAGIAVVLLGVTTFLTTTEPGRTEEEAAKATSAAAAQRSGPLQLEVPFDTGGTDGKGTVQLDLDPGRSGSNTLHLYVKRPNGSAFDVPEVKVSLTNEAKDVGPLPIAPDHIATGHWSANGVQVPMAGTWKIAVTVRTSDIDQITVKKNAQIG